jgi:hypothetical protein
LFEAALKEFGPLGIGPRATKALVAGGIFTIADLHVLTAGDLAGLPGIGPLTVKQLGAYLRKEDSATGDNAALLSVRFSEKMMVEVDKWALEQKGVVSRAEAIRRLVKAGLARAKE